MILIIQIIHFLNRLKINKIIEINQNFFNEILSIAIISYVLNCTRLLIIFFFIFSCYFISQN